MAGRLRKNPDVWVTEVIDDCIFSYLTSRAKEMRSTEIMRMIIKAIDGRICSVPHDTEVKFNVTIVMKDYEVTDYLIVKDCGTPKPAKLAEMVFVNMLAQAMPRYSMFTIHDESLIHLELRTINTKIVECRLRAERGGKV